MKNNDARTYISIDKSNHTKYLFLIVLSTIIVMVITVLTGCAEEGANNPHSNYHIDDTNKFSIENNASIPTSKSDENKKSLEKSKARRTALNSRLCPKLLQRDIDNPVITRKHEHMRGKYCDYYLYPKSGQTLAINSHGAELGVVLVMPETYNFTNGAYQVKDSRRHTIRVRYDGVRLKPRNFEYTIDFNLE